MLEVAFRYTNVLERFLILRDPSFDSISRCKRVGMRKTLVLRLLRLNEHLNSIKWLSDTQNVLLKKSISMLDKALVKRILKDDTMELE